MGDKEMVSELFFLKSHADRPNAKSDETIIRLMALLVEPVYKYDA